jgi:predicted transcriptional regulator
MTDRADEPMRRLSVEIPDSLHHRLRRLALDERTTLAAIVRELLEREVARRTKGQQAA